MTEVTCDMIRFHDCGEVSLVALIAVGIGQLIVAAYMTGLTISSHVSPGKREPGRIVIKGCRQPCRCGVAGEAIVAEGSDNVVRVHNRGKVLLVTLVAVGISQLIVAAYMTRLTLGGHVSPGEGECCVAVIERRWQPCRCCVTGLTIMTEVASNVVWFDHRCEFCLMTLVTVSVGQLIVASHVARLTLGNYVSSTQRERRAIMIKSRWQPRGACVAGLTIVTKIPRNVIRFHNSIEVRLMTLVAVGVR
jgi:hypothetical protein